MKNFKRFLSLALAVLMVAALAMTAFAAGEAPAAVSGGSIEVKNLAPNETHNIYKLFELQKVQKTGENAEYFYTANTAWSEFFNSEAVKDVFVTVKEDNSVVFIKEVDIGEFVQLAKAWLDANSSITADGTVTGTDTANSVTINNLNLGYYLIDACDGCVVSLVDTDEDKNATATIHKMEGSDKIDGEDNIGSITIGPANKPAVEGEVYSIYQVLTLESYSGSNYAYKFNSAWADVINWTYNNVYKISDYITVTSDGYVQSTMGPSDAPAFARLLLAYAKAKGINPVAIEKATTSNGKTEAKFENLKLGYYLVDSTLGTLCSLDTTNRNVEIEEKNELATNEKKVYENGDAGKKNDAAVGDTVKFLSTINKKTTTDKLVFHDTMSQGLTFLYNKDTEWNNDNGAGVGSITGVPKDYKDNINIGVLAQNDSTGTPRYLIEGVHYKVHLQGEEDYTMCDPNCTFEIEFLPLFFERTQNNNVNIDITYYAVLNENAVVFDKNNPDGTGNSNTSKITFGNSSSSTPSETKTYTYEIPFIKYAEDSSGNKTYLSDTHFTLSKNVINEDTTSSIVPVKLILVDDGETTTDGTTTYGPKVYRVATPDEITTLTEQDNPLENQMAKEIVTNSTGEFVIKGLDRGVYYLTETKPHDGYNKPKNPFTVEITKDGENTKIMVKDTEGNYVNYDKEGMNYVEGWKYGILNTSGVEMPSTGGIGTTIFYVVGSVLLVGAGVLLVTKKRMNTAK